jgi:uncharacterized membrane protein YgcG
MKAVYLITMLLIIASCGQKKEKPIDFMTNENPEIAADLPDAPRWLNDKEGILTDAEEDSINSLCEQLFNETGHMPMIHTIGDVSPYENLNDYTSALDVMWADAGQKYFIFIVSDALMEIRIVHGEVTESMLSPDFTDVVLQNEVYPAFRIDQYATGIMNALHKYLSSLKK